MSDVLGIHHVTAIAGDPQRNLDFYAGVLGLRLVKRTVDFDDPQTYHLHYGDEHGSPGTILTFFVRPGAPRGRRGVGQVAEIAFSVPPGRSTSGASASATTASPRTARGGAAAAPARSGASRSRTPTGSAWSSSSTWATSAAGGAACRRSRPSTPSAASTT